MDGRMRSNQDESALPGRRAREQALIASPDPLDCDDARTKNSDRIEVVDYHLILLWPILLKDLRWIDRGLSNPPREDNQQKAPPGDALLEQWAKYLCDVGQWVDICEIGDGCTLCSAPDDDDKLRAAARLYSEFVYFHPRNRRSLYVNRDDLRRFDGANARAARNSSLRILERTKDQAKDPVAELKVELWGERVVRMEVQATRLFLFDTGAAFLVLTSKFKGIERRSKDGDPEAFIRGLQLKDVLDLQDVVRRLYIPYWTTEFGAGLCPVELTVTFTNGDVLQVRPQGDKALLNDHLRTVVDDREPYVFTPWRELLLPIQPVQTDDKRANASQPVLRFEQIEDERMQLFSHVAVKDPRQIKPGDWARLATVDSSGDSDRYPYSPAFLAGEGFGQFAYDRFWSPEEAAPAQSWFTTRWLCCGYGFTAVGAGGKDSFFANQHNGVLAHFHHHYFKLGLLAHMHRASLLAFKLRIAKAVEKLRASSGGSVERGKHEREFRDELERISAEFLSFRTIHWTLEVSNQIQGRELFDLFSRHLNTRALFEDVCGEIRMATEIADGWIQRQMAEEQKTTVEALERNVKAIHTTQHNIEWVEKFIALVYSVEFVVGTSEFLKADGGWAHWVVSLVYIAVVFGLVRLMHGESQEADSLPGPKAQGGSRPRPPRLRLTHGRCLGLIVLFSLVYAVIVAITWADTGGHGDAPAQSSSLNTRHNESRIATESEAVSNGPAAESLLRPPTASPVTSRPAAGGAELASP